LARNITIRTGSVNHNNTVDCFPDECGLCHKNVEPTLLSGVFTGGVNTSLEMEVTFQCTNLDCNSVIIGYYSRTQYPGKFKLQRIAPITPVDRKFDEEIENLSGNFVTIFNQSFFAEQTGLTMISGIGYRKALEFLVKDYLIYLDGENEEMVLKMPLMQCINKLESFNIKEIAKRATWIGNDEAHYQRIWEDKDVNDLKKLIEITIHFIAMDIAAKKYLLEMTK
jgi:hypothetical protein